MIALAVVLSVIVMLLAVLVAGLLRSHADILRALHELGVGVGEPADASSPVGHHPGHDGQRPAGSPVSMGPPLPGERNSTSAPAVAGVTPGGDALAVSVARADHATLLAFLSSGCQTCAGFWSSFEHPDRLGLPAGTRLVVVTKGPDLEVPAEVARQAHRDLTVIMSTEAWGDYEVPGSPFFVLVDGRSGRRIGEGVANHFHQVAEMVRRAEADAEGFTATGAGGRRPRASTVPSVSWPMTASCWRPGSIPVTRASIPARWRTSTGPVRPRGTPGAVPMWARRPPGGLRWQRSKRTASRRRCPPGSRGASSPGPRMTAPFPIRWPISPPLPSPPRPGTSVVAPSACSGPRISSPSSSSTAPRASAGVCSPAAGMPRTLSPSDFRSYALRRGLSGQSGTQWFFTEAGRPFTLYVVLGSHARRGTLVPRVNQLLAPLAIAPPDRAPAAPALPLSVTRGAPWN